MGLNYPNAIIGVSLATKAKDLKRRGSVNSDSGASRNAGNLLNTAAQERIARAGVRRETDAPFWQCLLVEEAKFAIENPGILGHHALVLAFEDVKETLQVDGPSCGGLHSTKGITHVARGKFHAEQFRVRVVALLPVHSITIAQHICVDYFLSQHAEKDGSDLIGIE